MPWGGVGLYEWIDGPSRAGTPAIPIPFLPSHLYCVNVPPNHQPNTAPRCRRPPSAPAPSPPPPVAAVAATADAAAARARWWSSSSSSAAAVERRRRRPTAEAAAPWWPPAGSRVAPWLPAPVPCECDGNVCDEMDQSSGVVVQVGMIRPTDERSSKRRPAKQSSKASVHRNRAPAATGTPDTLVCGAGCRIRVSRITESALGCADPRAAADEPALARAAGARWIGRAHRPSFGHFEGCGQGLTFGHCHPQT